MRGDVNRYTDFGQLKTSNAFLSCGKNADRRQAQVMADCFWLMTDALVQHAWRHPVINTLRSGDIRMLTFISVVKSSCHKPQLLTH
jgi:hypothetical protein